jgi:uracil-DNA glycosylase
MNGPMQATLDPVTLLRFYVDSGVDEAIGDAPVDRFAAVEPPAAVLPLPMDMPAKPAPSPAPAATEGIGDARQLAAEAKTLEELRDALLRFKGLESLSRTATQLVFADGNPQARVMIVGGEPPGADEDRMGKPFAGQGGQLLDKMFAAIGLARETDLYITSLIHWRPPGDRPASDAELELSLPFVRRHIELVKPALLVLSGGIAAKALLQTADGITRLRGRWIDYTSDGLEIPIPVMVMFHPGYLLRSPTQKPLAWADLQAVQAKGREMGLWP